MKIYAKQIPPEYQTSPLYYDEWPENVYTFGNDRLIAHDDRIQDIRAGLERLQDNIEHMRSGAGGNLHAAIWYEFPRENMQGYTRAERLKWLELAREYTCTRDFSDEHDAITAALELITGYEWTCACMRGCCQSDWQYVIYPVKYGYDWFTEFETEYFNTGDEWNLYDENDDVLFSVYTHEWRDEDKRAEIADAADVDPSDVTLYEFDGYDRNIRYREV